MPLSAAERSRRYREKLKQNTVLHEQYLQKEHERYEKRKAEGSIKLIQDMTSREQRHIRKAWRQRKKQQRHKQIMTNRMLDDTPPSTPSHLHERRTSKSSSGRKRVRREKSASYRKIEKLKIKLQAKTREADKYRKRLHRHKFKLLDTNSPRSKTRLDLKGHKIRQETRKTLLFHNVLVKTLREKYKSAVTNKEKRVLDQVISSRLLKKYRIQGFAQKAFQISHKRVVINQKSHPLLSKRKTVLNVLSKSVEDFLTRDDNSRVKAGKRSTKTFKKDKKQVRLLNDTLKTLHLKYLAENTESKMSYPLFCRLKPFYVRHPKLSDRETCQCRRHENLTFKAEKLKLLSVIPTADLLENAKHIVCDINTKECMYRDCNNCKGRKVSVRDFEEGKMVEWPEWQTKRIERREDENGTGGKTVMTVKEKEKGTISTLVQEFQEELEKCCKHLFNIRHQYVSLRGLKEKLSGEDILIHIDFSENYGCKYSEEIQTMHFGASQRQVSLHTGVLYTRDKTESFCSMSDDLKHGPPGIWAHLLPVLKYAKNSSTQLRNLYCVSDGPTTQYRCKDNFYMLSTLPFQLGFSSINWSFMEAGHGKGPPDGIGAVIKRAADRAVLFGKDITDAKTLINAVNSTEVSTRLFYIPPGDFEEQEKNISHDLRAVAGTMKIHQIFTSTPGEIQFRDVSCFCCHPQECKCFNVQTHRFLVKPAECPPVADSAPENLKPQSQITKILHFDESFKGQFCVVTYDGKPYPGIVQEVDDSEISVNVMHSVGLNKFFWPRAQDVLWYSADNFVTLIPPPSKVGSRHHQIEPKLWREIQEYLEM